MEIFHERYIFIFCPSFFSLFLQSTLKQLSLKDVFSENCAFLNKKIIK